MMIGKLFDYGKRHMVAVALTVLALAGAAIGSVWVFGRSPSVPTLTVQRGEFVDQVKFRGEVKALKSVEVSTPAVADEMRILKIVGDGTQVKKGDSIVEFDKTKTEQELAQFRSVLKSAEAEIEQSKAQAQLTKEEDSNAVIKARYEVEVAKLEASKKEIVSRIEGEEAKLKLADAEQKLREMEQKLVADEASNKATIQNKKDASKKAAYDVQRAEYALTKMVLTAPMSGMVSLVRVWRREMPEPFKAGDTVWAGAPLAEMPDSSTLKVTARADETDRGRLAVRQTVTVHLDAIADREFTGKIESMSTLASMDFTAGWPFPRNFDVRIALDQTDGRVKPGMTAQVTVVVERIGDVITLPAQATFQRSGQTVVYVWEGSKFRERSIEIGRRSGDRLLVTRGLKPEERVALKDPTEAGQL